MILWKKYNVNILEITYKVLGLPTSSLNCKHCFHQTPDLGGVSGKEAPALVARDESVPGGSPKWIDVDASARPEKES